MIENDDAIFSELIIESKEHLENIEPDLLALEKESDDVSAEIVNSIFRAIHSIKGGFGFYGLKNIQTLSHVMESVLMQVRDGEIPISAEMTDALLAGVDKLRLMLDDVEGSESVSIEAECAPLFAISDKDKKSDQSIVKKRQQLNLFSDFGNFDLSPKEILSSMEGGHNLYLLEIHCPEDLIQLKQNGSGLLATLQELGNLITSDPPFSTIETLKEDEENSSTFSIVYSSVLEIDFIIQSLQISSHQCNPVDIDEPDDPDREIAEKQSLPEEQNIPAGPKENSNAPARKTKRKESVETIRVKVSLLNNLMTHAGELVLGRNQIKQALNTKISSALSSTAALKRFETGIANSRQMIHESLQNDSRLKDDSGKNDRLMANVDREMTQILHNFRSSLGLNLIDMPGISGIMQNVDLVTSKLQNNIMNTRMQPVDAVFSKFPRIIRDTAKKLSKEIQLTVEGGEVELDKSVIETLGDPLNHLIRNCADHGIEAPAIREDAGKSSCGTIILRAYHEAGMVNIDIIDDGAGLDVNRIVDKAISTGSISRDEADKMTLQESMALIFNPGLSTASQVTDVSGRGVGMDVVKTNIEKLGGEIFIDSTHGQGTRINLKLPLTLAIIPSLIIAAGGRTFAVPQVNIEELVRIRAVDIPKQIEEIQNKPVLRLRNKLLPLVRLDEALGLGRTYLDSDGVRCPEKRDGIIDRRSREDDSGNNHEEKRTGTRRVHSKNALNILVLKVGPNRYGLIVERLYDNEEIVVKPLSSYFSNCNFYSGTTIMGDGRVAMILDAAGIAGDAGLRFEGVLKKEGALQADRYHRQSIRETQTLLLFRNGTTELFAVNLAMVARIEKVKISAIKEIGDQEYIDHENSSMRILRLHNFLPVQEPDEQPENFYVIIPKLVTDPMGIVASKIVDIVDTAEEINTKTISGPGVIGALSLEEGLIVVVNIYSLFDVADPNRSVNADTDINIEGLKVLLAEDTGFFRAVERDYLESIKCDVDIAKDGIEAWEKLSQNPYDLLVTDIVMPGMDGIELTERVRASAEFNEMPIIAVTSLMSESDRARITNSGVDAYESKLDKEHLLQTIHKVMASRAG